MLVISLSKFHLGDDKPLSSQREEERADKNGGGLRSRALSRRQGLKLALFNDLH